MQQVKFSPQKYIKENAKKIPIEKCLISDAYHQHGLTICLIIKKQPGGKFMFASFMVDRMCLGVKSCLSNCNFTELQIDELIDKMSSQGVIEEVTPVYFNNLIYGAIDYAKELGFDPPKDFALPELLLDENLVDDGIDDIEMGWEGKPYFIQGPYDDVKRIFAKLNASVGEGNYIFTTGNPNF